MPANGTVDERIVEMRIDHQKFESGAKKTISILENLDKGLKSLGSKNTDGFDNIASSLDKVTNKISIFGTVGDQIIRTLTNKAMELVGQMGRLANTLTIDQLAAGWDKYAEKTQGVQTIMAATAKDWEDQGAQMAWVNEQLEKLNWFTDETSYSFLDMVNNIGKFTSNGVQLETAVTAMEGISTWAAISGANVQEASRAMYNLSQALATGSVKLIDWKSIENANMATREFKETALETAAAMGTLEKVGDGMWRTLEGHDFTTEQFNTQLADAWFTSDVLLATLDQYGSFTDALNEESVRLDMTATELLEAIDAFKIKDEEELLRIAKRAGVSVDDLNKSLSKLSDEQYELGLRAFKAAQEAKTFKEAIDATKDAVSTGWMNIWETIFGGYLEAKELWTDLAETLYNVFAEPVNKLLDLIDVAFGGEREKDIVEPMSELAHFVEDAGYSMDQFSDSFEAVDPYLYADLLNTYGNLDEAFKNGAVDAETFRKILIKLAETGKTSNKQFDVEGPKGTEVALTNNSIPIPEDPDALQRQADALEAYNTLLDNSEAILDRWAVNLREAETAEEEAATGGELFREGLMNIFNVVNDVSAAVQKALDIVFGDPENDLSWTDVYGEKLYNLLERFNKFTEGLKLNEEGVSALTDRIVSVIETFQKVGNIFDTIFSGIRFVVSNIFGAIKQSGILGSIWRSLLMIFEGLIAPIRILVDYFSSLFKAQQAAGKMTWVETLAGWLGKVGELLEKTATKFRDFMQSEAVVKGIATAINVIGTGLSTVFGWLGKVFAALTPVWRFVQQIFAILQRGFERNGISGAFENLGRYMQIILKDHPRLLAFFNMLRSAFGTIGNLVSTGVSAIGKWFSSFDFSKLTDFFSSFKNIGFLDSVSEWLSKFFSSAKEFFTGFKIDTSGLTSGFERVKEVFGLIFEGLFGDPTALKERAKTAILNLFAGIKEALEGITIKDVFLGMRLAGLATLITEITGIFATFRDLEKQVVGIPQSISKMFGNLGDAFKNLSLSFKANTLVKVLIGVGILAASLYILSKIPKDDLTHAAVVVGLLFLVIAKIATGLANSRVKGVQSVDIKKFQVFSDLAGALIGIALVILAVGSAIARIARIIQSEGGLEAVLQASGLIGVFLFAVAAIVLITVAMAKKMTTYKRMDAVGNMLLKVAGSMTIIALAIGALVTPLIILATAIRFINTEANEFGQAGADIFAFAVILGVIMLGLIAILSVKTTTPAKIEKMGNTLLKIAGSMWIISMAIGALVLPMVALAAGIRWVGSEEMGKAGAWLAIFGLLLGGIMLALAALVSRKGMTADKISAVGKTMMQIAGSMAIVALAIGLLALPIIEIAAAYKLLGDNAMAEAMNAILAFAVIVGILGGIMFLAGKYGNGKNMLLVSASMLILAIAINFLVPALASFIAIGSGLMAMAVSVEQFWSALGRLAALAGVMIVFGVAILAVGAGIALFGIGILGAGVGAIILAGGLLLLSLAIGKLGEVFPMFINGIASAGETIKDHWKEIIIGTAAFVAMAVAIGLLIRSIGKLMGGERFGRGFGAFTSSLATGIGTMISKIGSKILDDLPKLLPILGAILIMAAAYFVGLIPELTTICVDAFVTLLNSVATELENNQDSIVDSVTRIVTAAIGIAKQVAVELLGAVLDEVKTSWSEAFTDGFHFDKFAIALLETIVLLAFVGKAILGVMDFVGKAKTTISLAMAGVSTAAATSSGSIISSLGSILFWLILVIGTVAALRQGFIDLGNQFEDAEKSRNEELFGNADATIDERINKFAELRAEIKRLTDETEAIMESGDVEKIGSEEYAQMLADLQTYQIQVINAQSDLARDLAEVTGESYQDVYKQLSEAEDYTQTEIYKKYLDIISQGREALEETPDLTSLEDYEAEITKIKAQIASLQSDDDSGKNSDAQNKKLEQLKAQLETLITDYENLKRVQESVTTSAPSDLGSDAAAGETRAQRSITVSRSDVAGEVVDDMTGGILEGEGAVQESVRDTLYSALTNAQNDPAISGMLSEWGIDINDLLATGIDENGNVVEGSLLSTVLNAVKSGGSDPGVYSSSWTNGYNVGSGYADGIWASFPLVEAAARAMANISVSATAGPDGIDAHSPSRVFARLGAFVPAGFAKGIKDNSDTAEDSVTIMASGVIAAMQQAMARVAMIADEDFDISPRITPVVDMSNLTTAAGTADSMFGTLGSAMRGSIRVSTDRVQTAAGVVQHGNDSNSTVIEMQRLSEKLDKLGDDLFGMQIVLDSGALVGATSRKMDGAFGALQARKGRGN